MSDKTKALLWRASLGLILVELPVLTYQLQQPTFDYRVLAVGLLGAAAGYLETYATFNLLRDPSAVTGAPLAAPVPPGPPV